MQPPLGLPPAPLTDHPTNGTADQPPGAPGGLSELRAFLDEFWTAKLALIEHEIRVSR
jgi:hypothetical protein